MNNKVALHIDYEFMIGVSNPKKGMYTPLKFSSEEERYRCYFYFLINKATKDFGKKYKKGFIENKECYYGDFIDLIKKDKEIKSCNNNFFKAVELLKITGVTDKIIELYKNERVEDHNYSKLELILSFSNNIPEEVKKKIVQFLKEEGFIINLYRHSFMQMLTLKYRLKQQENCLLLEAVNNWLNISVFKPSYYEKNIVSTKSYLGETNQQAQIIKELIEDKLKDSYGITPTKKILRYVADNVSNWWHDIAKNTVPPRIFPIPNDKERFVIIKKEEIDIMSDSYFSSFVENYIEPVLTHDVDIHTIILLGEDLSNEKLRTAISKFFKIKGNKIIYFPGKNIYFLLEYLIRHYEEQIKYAEQKNKFKSKIDSFLQSGDLEDAISFLENNSKNETIIALKNEFKIEDIKNKLGIANKAEEEGKFTEALGFYKQVNSLYPIKFVDGKISEIEKIKKFETLGLENEIKHNIKEAINYYNKIFTILPNQHPLYTKTKNKIDILQKKVRDANKYKERAKEHYKSFNYLEALEDYKKCSSIIKDSETEKMISYIDKSKTSLVKYGDIMIKVNEAISEKKWIKAGGFLKEAMDIFPKDEEAKRIYDGIGLEIANAEKKYHKLVKEGENYLNEKNYKSAIVKFSEANRIKPSTEIEAKIKQCEFNLKFTKNSESNNESWDFGKNLNNNNPFNHF